MEWGIQLMEFDSCSPIFIRLLWPRRCPWRTPYIRKAKNHCCIISLYYRGYHRIIATSHIKKTKRPNHRDGGLPFSCSLISSWNKRRKYLKPDLLFSSVVPPLSSRDALCLRWWIFWWTLPTILWKVGLASSLAVAQTSKTRSHIMLRMLQCPTARMNKKKINNNGWKNKSRNWNQLVLHVNTHQALYLVMRGRS